MPHNNLALSPFRTSVITDGFCNNIFWNNSDESIAMTKPFPFFIFAVVQKLDGKNLGT